MHNLSPCQIARKSQEVCKMVVNVGSQWEGDGSMPNKSKFAEVAKRSKAKRLELNTSSAARKARELKDDVERVEARTRKEGKQGGGSQRGESQ